MAIISIDQQQYETDPARNVLQVALSMGLDLPYFCWHPALGSVGACRQCAVKQFKDENDTKGTIVMACMVPAIEGTRISIDDPEAREFRESVIEWLMTNHPHDCPVCDEGGECHLQDMTVMTDHAHRRYRFTKRTYRNQDLGPFINHEMNRCIQCYRCVRFYKDYAGGHDLDAFAAHNHVYFGRHEDGVLESEFSGNLIEVCPTGVFTDKTLKPHYARKWDLLSAPSVCAHCGLGCNTIASERYGVLRRILNRYHHELNGYFLCDRGRFGYDFVNHTRRIREPLWRERDGSAAVTLSKAEILMRLAPLLGDRSRLIGIGSPRASLEANHALRELVGAGQFCHGMADGEAEVAQEIVRVLSAGPARAASMREIEEADAVLVLGEDLTNTAPRMALALRQAVRNAPLADAGALKIPPWHDRAQRDAIQQRRGPLHLACVTATKLDEIAATRWRAAPDDLARLGFAVAHELDPAAPAVADLTDEERTWAQRVARDLTTAKRPLVIAGASLGNVALVQAAANIARALCKSEPRPLIALVVPEANTLGAVLLQGGSLTDAAEAVANGSADTLIVLENDLFRRGPAEQIEKILGSAKHIIALDFLSTATTTLAHAVLPVGTFAEADGTLINYEGRAQRFFQAMAPDGAVQESWRWLRDLAVAAGHADAGTWPGLDDVLKSLALAHPALARIVEAAPTANDGAVWARASRRFSGRTSIQAAESVHEPKPPHDADAPLSFTMEGSPDVPPPALLNRYWDAGWNSVQALNRFQSEVGGPLRGGDPGVHVIQPIGTGYWFGDIPPAFKPSADGLLAVPLHHIFGSEELSVHADAIASRCAQPYIALNSNEAAKRSLHDGDETTFTVGAAEYRLPLRILPELPDGTAGMPVGLVGLTGIQVPCVIEFLMTNDS